MNDLLDYEKKLYKKNIDLIGGIDEVGRGPLVGDVVAACVILPKNYHLEGLTDSKKLSEKKRNLFYKIIKKDAISIGVGMCSPEEIDEYNIYQATKIAMNRAIENMTVKPEYLLIDAMKLDTNIPFEAIIKGDQKSLSIAAASVIAKVTRDEQMYKLDKLYPEYGFKDHKGYPTKKHLEALKKYGALSNYRLSYGPLKNIKIRKEKEIEFSHSGISK